MARPRKAVVDYFPHNTTHGKTLFILQSRWGNDGYATWYKLLEQLGNTDNHVIDFNDQSTVMHLAAYCMIPENTLVAILDFLAAVSAIHPGFWRRKYIYSENFVAGVTDAYRKRINSLPTITKVSGALNINLTEFPAEETRMDEVSGAGSTEREREREREREITSTPPSSLLSKKTTEEEMCTPACRMPMSKIQNLHIKFLGRIPDNQPVVTVLQDICRQYPPERIEVAFKAVVTADRPNLNWIRKYLDNPRNWVDQADSVQRTGRKSYPEQWRETAARELGDFVNGGDNDQDNGQQRRQGQICSGDGATLQSAFVAAG